MTVPLIFADKTGSLFGSEFSDVYDRMYLCVSRTRRDTDGAAQYSIYNTSVAPSNTPVAALEYGAGGALGTVTFNLKGRGGRERTHAMSAFLTIVGG